MPLERRSSRTNKGQHSKRTVDEVYYLDEADGESNAVKKKQTTDSDYDQDDEPEEDANGYDEEVRCVPCGTTSENYDEETDEGGTMIQCDQCNTWQHARCMGYRSPNAIPKRYLCDQCSPTKAAKARDIYSIENLREKHRLSSAKAFLSFFKKVIPETFSFPEGFDHDRLANKWTLDLEKVIFQTAPKKYNEESRRILFLIKKPSVTQQILDRELTFERLVHASPEEIDLDLKKYAEKVRQESIRRSVLTSDDSQGQRIRRTHKGEEIVEDVSTQPEEVDGSIVSKNIDHRRFNDDTQERKIVVNENTKPVYNYYDDDDDNVSKGDDSKQQETPADASKSSESSDIDPVPELDDDDELDYIINGRKKKTTPSGRETVKTSNSTKTLTSTLPKNVWNGQITFPEFATFRAQGDFYNYSNYHESATEAGVRLHNRYIKISKEVMSRSSYEVEGRLDRTRADAYLSKITATRDILLVQLRCINNQADFDKLYNYLLNKNKVGVLSGKPTFVKDSYLLAIDFYDPSLPSYLKDFKTADSRVGLYALYVVKKDYIPSAPGILKKSSSTQSSNSSRTPENSQLSAILQQLNSGTQTATPAPSNNFDSLAKADAERLGFTNNSAFSGSQNFSNGILTNMTNDQKSLLDQVCQSNPQIASNPELYLQALKSYLTNNAR